MERRTPTQERSREKYQTILETATRLIGEHGIDAVSMREIAKQSDVAYSSIYQYFPDKNAVLVSILEVYFEQIRHMFGMIVATANDIESLKAAVAQGIEGAYQLFSTEPALANLWTGMQANPQLREMDARDARVNARTVAKKIHELLPHTDPEQVYDSVLVLVFTISITMHAVLSSDKEDEIRRIVEACKRLVIVQINAYEQEANQ